MNICMGNPFKKPKAPQMPKITPPKPIPPRAEMVDLQAETASGASNFEAELKRRRKKSQTSFAGETGGYGGSTKLG